MKIELSFMSKTSCCDAFFDPTAENGDSQNIQRKFEGSSQKTENNKKITKKEVRSKLSRSFSAGSQTLIWNQSLNLLSFDLPAQKLKRNT